jgi:hypothetical protein
MIKVAHLFLLALLSLLSVACATSDKTINDKTINDEPGCLDVIICSEPEPKTQGEIGMH